jgi:hypothetical protein
MSIVEKWIRMMPLALFTLFAVIYHLGYNESKKQEIKDDR